MQNTGPTLVTRKPARNAVQDKDLALLARMKALTALSVAAEKTVADRINARIEAGAEMTLKEWNWNNGDPVRITRAKAAGGGT